MVEPSLLLQKTIVSNLPDLSQFLSMSNNAEKLDVTKTMDSLVSSTLDMVAALRLREIKGKIPAL